MDNILCGEIDPKRHVVLERAYFEDLVGAAAQLISEIQKSQTLGAVSVDTWRRITKAVAEGRHD